MLAVIFRFFSFGIRDFAIDLRQGFKAAHREQRVSKADDHHHDRQLGPERAVEPAQRRAREWLMFSATGSGGSSSIAAQQQREQDTRSARSTTMTVVICMMRSALPLDSWMPLILLHQK